MATPQERFVEALQVLQDNNQVEIARYRKLGIQSSRLSKAHAARDAPARL